MSGSKGSNAIERALSIMEALAQRKQGLTNSEISRRLGIPKSSACYILSTLERRGYLSRDQASGKYRLGLKVLSLSGGVQVGTDLREAARPALGKLVERTGLTVHLAILDRGEIVYIDKLESPAGLIRINTWVGRRMDIHSTGVGKVIVAYLPKLEAEALINGRELKKWTPKTIASSEGFLRELEKVRARGYAIDDEENCLGVRCVAAPVFDAAGKIRAAVGVSGTTGQIDRASIAKLALLVREAADEISESLGYKEPRVAHR
jgi:DNA-binding IclR family transcriptional regulator